MIIHDLYDYEFLNIGSYYECLLSHPYYAFLFTLFYLLAINLFTFFNVYLFILGQLLTVTD